MQSIHISPQGCVKATEPCSSFLAFKDCDQYGEIRFLCYQVRIKLKTTIDMDILFKCKASIIGIFCCLCQGNQILLMCKAFIFPKDAEPLSVGVTHRSVVCLLALLFVQRVKSDLCLPNESSQITFFEPKVGSSL